MLTIKTLEKDNLTFKGTCSNLHVEITKDLQEQIKQGERNLVASEARDKCRDYFKLMTGSTRKVSALL
jgi:hypothetical protein